MAEPSSLRQAHPRVENEEFIVDDHVLRHGEVSLAEFPGLNLLLESVTMLGPSSLTVDLSETSLITIDALAIITGYEAKVDHLYVRFPVHAQPTTSRVGASGLRAMPVSP
jgi:hypothetical protein